jgi:hypothetical protein
VSILDEPLLREDEAAKELKVRPQTMSAWRFRGQGPAYVKVGKLVFYRPSDIRAYVASRTVRPTAHDNWKLVGAAAATVVAKAVRR